jgi:alpha,alpha-trehalose-phosphate synthase [UDP-forming]
MTEKPRLIVVSNRLPISVSKKGSEWEFKETGGGLATALSGLKKKKDFLWVGWIGRDIPKDDRESLTTKCRAQLGTIPVYLSNREINQYYNGFSNRVLWPLFHYTPDSVHFDQQEWETYQKVNKKFAQTIAENANSHDTVWIHDFHLMLVPKMLRELRPDLKIGFFLHIPFPSSEIFRILPVRQKLIEGVLGSDLIGFHCFGYERHFISTSLRLLGCEVGTNTIHWQGRKIKLGVYPIGINPESFEEILRSKKCQQQIKILKKRIGDRKLILGVDRLDYSKGIPHKLSGYSWFLEKYPEHQKEVLLYQVAVPSRTQVEEYQDLKFEVDRLVGDINGKYASVEQSPIYYLFKSVSQTQLVALYALADMMLITSIRDGMNLVALEYAICNQDKKGSLLLSEFTGVAHSLGGANLINPWDQDSIADAIKNSLSSSKEDKEHRYQLMHRYARDNYPYQSN